MNAPVLTIRISLTVAPYDFRTLQVPNATDLVWTPTADGRLQEGQGASPEIRILVEER